MFDFSDYYDKIAEEMPANCRVVEIGAGDGASALYLAKKLYDLNKSFKLYMVDNMDYGGYLQMKTIYQNIIKSGLGEYIEVIPMSSLEASKLFNEEYLHFIFLDSSHQYDETKESIRVWFPKLVSGYKFGGHDFYEYNTVRDAVYDTIPLEFQRPQLDETVFEVEDILNIVQTKNNYGIWEFKKRWYLELINENV